MLTTKAIKKEIRTVNVVFFYYALLHYRASLFNYLAESKELDFQIVCGKNISQFDNMKYYETDRDYVTFVHNKVVSIFGHKFLLQFKALRAILKLDPEILVLRGVNPQLISTHFVFFYYKIFKPKVKILWWGHGTLGNQGKFGQKLRLIFYRNSNGVLIQGQKGVDILSDAGLEKDKLFLIGNNLNDSDLGYLNHDIKPKQATDRLNIVFVGRVVQEKRIDLLLDALKMLQKEGHVFSCKIIGQGPVLDDLKNQAETFGLTNSVEFCGAKYGEELENYFLESDLVIIPDYVGLSIIQGLSYGLPFICSDDFNHHGPEMEVFQSKINGTIYPKNNAVGLKNEIIYWHKLLQQPNNIANDCIQSISNYTTEFVGNNVINTLVEKV